MNFLFFEQLGKPVKVLNRPNYKHKFIFNNGSPPLWFPATYEGYLLLGKIYLNVGGEYFVYRELDIRNDSRLIINNYICNCDRDSLEDLLHNMQNEIYSKADEE